MTHKDRRLTVRISSDLDEWLAAEGLRRGLDKAAFARMALFERMNGVSAAAASELMAHPAPQPVERDFLDVASQERPLTQEPEPDQQYADINVDDLVTSSLEQAEAQGLTQPIEREAPQQFGGTRALMRPPPRYSAGNAPRGFNQ